VGETIEYLLYRGLAAVVQSLSLRGTRKFARGLAWIAFHLVPIRKSLTLRQLRLAFPEKPEAEIAAIALESYRSFITTMLEMLWFPNFTTEEVRRNVRLENPDIVRQALRKGKGLILLSGHIGSWEMFAFTWKDLADAPLLGVVHSQHNSRVAGMVDRLRSLRGNRFVDMKKGLRDVLRTLRNRGIILLLTDQSAPKEAFFVPFFGRPAATYEGAAYFAIKTQAPMVMALGIRQPDGGYAVQVEEVPTEDMTEATPENMLKLTARHVAILEKFVRRYPGQWLWQHRRWKHTPPDASAHPALPGSA